MVSCPELLYLYPESFIRFVPQQQTTTCCCNRSCPRHQSPCSICMAGTRFLQVRWQSTSFKITWNSWNMGGYLQTCRPCYDLQDLEPSNQQDHRQVQYPIHLQEHLAPSTSNGSGRLKIPHCQKLGSVFKLIKTMGRSYRVVLLTVLQIQLSILRTKTKKKSTLVLNLQKILNRCM